MTKLVFLAFLAMAVAFGEAATITVGDTTGWIVPPNADFYDNWEDTQNITVGDTLVFNFDRPHDVAIVTEAAYDACVISSPISISTTSPFSFTITNTSDLYFICTIGTHCVNGQKLSVTDVIASSTTPTPSTPAPPPPTANGPSSSTTPPTANGGPSSSTTPPPPPPPSNSAQSISSAFSVVAAAMAVAFFA